jgi:hypothetical protein
MTGHIIIEVPGLKQLALEKVIPGKGVRWEGGCQRDRCVRCQLAGIHQDGTDDIWTNPSSERGGTLLPHHLQKFRDQNIRLSRMWTYSEQSVEAMLIVQSLVHWLGHISLQANLYAK